MQPRAAAGRPCDYGAILPSRDVGSEEMGFGNTTFMFPLSESDAASAMEFLVWNEGSRRLVYQGHPDPSPR